MDEKGMVCLVSFDDSFTAILRVGLWTRRVDGFIHILAVHVAFVKAFLDRWSVLKYKILCAGTLKMELSLVDYKKKDISIRHSLEECQRLGQSPEQKG